MTSIRVRWHVVATAVLAVIVLSVASLITGVLRPCRGKCMRCRAMLDRLSMLIRYREQICKETGVDEKAIDDVTKYDPASGIASYCLRVSPEFFVIRAGRNDRKPRIMDAWGNPLVVQMRGAAANGGATAPYFRFGNHWIRVWSAGANGIDEKGEGDDIIMDARYIGAESFALMPDDSVSKEGRTKADENGTNSPSDAEKVYQ